MSSVKVIRGTENYLLAATERNHCQDQVTLQECHAEAYLKKSVELCQSIHSYWSHPAKNHGNCLQ